MPLRLVNKEVNIFYRRWLKITLMACKTCESILIQISINIIKMVAITLPSAGDGTMNEYAYVLLTSLWIAFQCYMTGFLVVEVKRAKTFTDEYMNKNFLDEHKKAFPNDKRVPKYGYPDMGCGHYSSKLTYKEWFEFNLAQRVHGNFLEQVMTVCLLVLVAGIRHPAYTVYLGIAYSVARIFNAYGYSRTVKGRVPGFILCTLCMFTLFGLSVHTLLGLM